MDDDTFDTDDGSDGQVRHDWEESGRPSIGVTEAIAAVTDRSVSALPPLHETIDPEALDALVTDDGPRPVEVDFSYAGEHVWVHSDGTVLITAK